MNINLKDLYSLNKNSTKEKIKEAFNKICPFTRNTIELNKHNKIYRVRTELEPFLIKNKTHISYNPKKEYIEQGRINIAGEQIFYGTTPPHNSKVEINQHIKSAVLEGSKLIASPIDKENGYLGTWKCTKNITLFLIHHNPNHIALSQAINEIQQSCEKMIHTQSNNPQLDIQINNWLAYIFTAKESSYNISSTISHLILEKDYDGIMYPSVRNDHGTFNISLTKNAADTLELDNVLMFKNTLQNESITCEFLQKSERILDGNISQWKKSSGFMKIKLYDKPSLIIQ